MLKLSAYWMRAVLDLRQREAPPLLKFWILVWNFHRTN